MKREGRQHGTVRTLCIIPSSPLGPSRPAQRKGGPALGSPPTAGVFTRVPAKPTNHSKPTGKCNRARCSDCHLHPSWKSKDKIKGARNKLRAADSDLGYGGLLALRVAAHDACGPHNYKLKFSSCSATRILDELVTYDYDHHDDYPFDDYPCPIDRDRTRGDPFIPNKSLNLDCLDEYPFISPPSIIQISREIVNDDEDEDDEDEDMGFYDVAIVWDPIDGDEGWSLIGEI